MRGLMIFLLGLVAAASAIPRNSQRIVGGTTTTIYNYPDMAAMLAPFGAAGYRQNCGGIILNNRSVITAAHCTYGRPPNALRSRIGSTYANYGGVVHTIALIFNHPQYNTWTLDNDISIVRTHTEILFTQAIRAALIAGPTYNVPDNAVVWATGWGLITPVGPSSEVLRHVNIYSVNQHVCRQRYGSRGMTITDNMLCSGVLDVGGRDQCTQDSGGPLYHNGVVVGVCSFGPTNCGDPFLPGVNVRISRYTTWINNHR